MDTEPIPQKISCDTCGGYEESECCNALMMADICLECGEHTENQCRRCDEGPNGMEGIPVHLSGPL